MPAVPIVAIIIILVYALAVYLMATGKLPMVLGLLLMAFLIGLSAMPYMEFFDIVTTGIYRFGEVTALVVLGGWLGMMVAKTGVADNIIIKAVELAGEKAFPVALACYIACALCFAGGLTGIGGEITIGQIALPIMVAVGVTPVLSSLIFAIAYLATGMLSPAFWKYYSSLSGVTVDQIMPVCLTTFAISVVFCIIMMVAEFKRQGIRMFDGASVPIKREVKKVPWYSLPSPIIPLLLILILKWPFAISFIIGILYCFVTTMKWTREGIRDHVNLLGTAWYDGVKALAPTIAVLIGLGILVNVCLHPTIKDAMATLLAPVIPHDAIGLSILFAVLAPLALYRGPLGIWGLGAGLLVFMIGSGVDPLLATGVMLSIYSMTRLDPSQSENVWLLGYMNVDHRQYVKTGFPYYWACAATAVIVNAFLYFI